MCAMCVICNPINLCALFAFPVDADVPEKRKIRGKTVKGSVQMRGNTGAVPIGPDVGRLPAFPLACSGR